MTKLAQSIKSLLQRAAVATAQLISAFILVLTPAVAQGPDPLPRRIQTDENGVDPATGDIHLYETDLTIGTPGAGGLSFSRVLVNGDWRTNTLGTVSSGGSGKVLVSIGDSSDEFTVSGGVYASTEGSGATLTYDSGTSKYTYTDRAGVVYIFDAALAAKFYGVSYLGVMTSTTKPDGEVVTYNYKSVYIPYLGAWASRIQSVTNNYGYQLHFRYADNSNPPPSSYEFGFWQRIADISALNNTIDYCAPLSDNCWPFSGPWTPLIIAYYNGKIISAGHSGGQTKNYTFTGDCLTSIQYSGRAAISLTCDAQGRVETINRGYGTWTYNYTDDAGTLRRTTTVTDPAGKVRTTISSIATASSGQIISMTDETNKTASYLYDALGRTTRITLPEGNYTQIIYDSAVAGTTRGNVIGVILGGKSGATPATITRMTAVYPASCANLRTCNKPTSVTDARGYATTFTYDANHGGVLTVTSPTVASGTPQTRYSYAQKQARYKNSAATFANGSPIFVLTEKSACATGAGTSCVGTAVETKTTIAYPAATSTNNLSPTWIEIAAGNASIATRNTFGYDALGNIATVDGPLSGSADTVMFFYDAYGKQLGEIGPDPDGAGPLNRRATKATYPDFGPPANVRRGTAATQDQVGFDGMTVLTSEDSISDSYGRLLQTRAYDGATTVSLTQNSYDSLGRLDCTAVRMNPATFASPPSSACTLAAQGPFGPDRITKTVYDDAGRTVQTLTGYGTSAQQTTAIYTYSNNGLVKTLKNARNRLTTYTYDGYDRSTRVQFPTKTGNNTSSSTDDEWFTYDDAFNIATFERRSGNSALPGPTFTNTYDALNRLTARNGPGSSLDSTYAYDNFGRLTSTGENGQTLNYGYDALSRLLSETGQISASSHAVSYQYDAAGRRTRITWPDTTALYVQYGYDLTGAMTTVLENGTTNLATYAYDDLGRRSSISRGNGATTSYFYDGASRLTSLVQNLAGTSQDVTQTFAVNPAGGIVSQATSNAFYEWTLSADFTNAYSANGLDELTLIDSTSVAHDDRGNTTAVGAKTYGYDDDNRLVSASGGGLAASTLAYDPAGRLKWISSTAFRRFLYDGDQAIAEYTSSNTLLRRFVPGASADETLVWYEGSGLTNKNWIAADARGSVLAVMNSSGAATATNSYDAYGVPASTNSSLRFGYTGQMWLGEIELYHYKARAYNPETGRFMQTDPIGYAGGLNLYAYAGNDPVNVTDPSGLYDDEIVVYGTKTNYDPCPFCYEDFTSYGWWWRVPTSTIAQQISAQTKVAIDQTLCGDSGTYAKDFKSAAKRLLPSATAKELARATYWLEYAYNEARNAQSGFNEPGGRYTSYAGEDVGSYVYRRPGDYTAGPGNVAAPYGVCYDCQAGINPESGVFASVVSPYINRRTPTIDDYADRIYRREPIYNTGASNIGAPVIVGTPFGVCIFGGGS